MPCVRSRGRAQRLSTRNSSEGIAPGLRAGGWQGPQVVSTRRSRAAGLPRNAGAPTVFLLYPPLPTRVGNTKPTQKKKKPRHNLPIQQLSFHEQFHPSSLPPGPCLPGLQLKTSERNEKEKGVLQTTADSPPAERRHQETWSWCSGHRAGKYRAVTCAPQALLHIFRPCNNKNGKNCNS